MFKTACILSVALTALLASAPAHAGQTGSIPVTIDDSTRTAFGSIGGGPNTPPTASSTRVTGLGFVRSNPQGHCFASGFPRSRAPRTPGGGFLPAGRT